MTARRSASVYGIRLAAEPVSAQAGAGLGHSGVYSGVDGGAQRILAAVRGRGGVLDVKDAVKDAPLGFFVKNNANICFSLRKSRIFKALN